MFTGLMVNTWIAATVVAVIAGGDGFFAVLRGATFAAHAIPNGAFAGAAGASLLGGQHRSGLGVFSMAGALGIGRLAARGRHDVSTALALVLMLGVGALFVSLSTEYAPEPSRCCSARCSESASEKSGRSSCWRRCRRGDRVMFRPLLLASALPEVAEAHGVSARRLELGVPGGRGPRDDA